MDPPLTSKPQWAKKFATVLCRTFGKFGGDVADICPAIKKLIKLAQEINKKPHTPASDAVSIKPSNPFYPDGALDTLTAYDIVASILEATESTTTIDSAAGSVTTVDKMLDDRDTRTNPDAKAALLVLLAAFKQVQALTHKRSKMETYVKTVTIAEAEASASAYALAAAAGEAYVWQPYWWAPTEAKTAATAVSATLVDAYTYTGVASQIEVWPKAECVFVDNVLEYAVATLDNLVMYVNYQDDLIDSAEMRATFENSKKALAGTCEIRKEVAGARSEIAPTEVQVLKAVKEAALDINKQTQTSTATASAAAAATTTSAVLAKIGTLEDQIRTINVKLDKLLECSKCHKQKHNNDDDDD